MGLALDSTPIRDLGAALYVVLLAAWVTVAARTVRGAIGGRVFLPA